MKRNLWIMAATVVLVLAAAGYTIAQSTGNSAQGRPGWMMGSGTGMMGSGGYGGMMGGRTAGWGIMNTLTGQPLSQEQVEQFAEQHGITVEQAKQMTEACTQIMAETGRPQQGQ
jgi:hypothetical protein